MEKKKRVPKSVSVLKEERQAFGLLAAKAMNLRDALKYPITSVPLAIANPDSSVFRKIRIKKCVNQEI